MGMYDTLTVKAHLPGIPDAPEREFQTKDLDLCLSHFELDAEGRLWRIRRGLRDDPAFPRERLTGVSNLCFCDTDIDYEVEFVRGRANRIRLLSEREDGEGNWLLEAGEWVAWKSPSRARKEAIQ